MDDMPFVYVFVEANNKLDSEKKMNVSLVECIFCYDSYQILISFIEYLTNKDRQIFDRN